MGQGKEWSFFEMATLKRQPFEGEKEVRLISNLLDTVVDGNTGNIIKPKQIDNGIFVGVNLYRLLEEVVISLDADDQWVAKIKALVEQINDRLPRNSERVSKKIEIGVEVYRRDKGVGRNLGV